MYAAIQSDRTRWRRCKRHACFALLVQVMEDDEHYVDDPNNPQYHQHGGEYAYQGGNSGADFEGEGFQGEHEGYEASGNHRNKESVSIVAMSFIPTKTTTTQGSRLFYCNSPSPFG